MRKFGIAADAEQARPRAADAEGAAAEGRGEGAYFIKAGDKRAPVRLMQPVRKAEREHLLIAALKCAGQQGETGEIVDGIRKGNTRGQGGPGGMGAQSIVRGKDDKTQRGVYRVGSGLDPAVTQGRSDEAAEKRGGQIVGMAFDRSDYREEIGF